MLLQYLKLLYVVHVVLIFYCVLDSLIVQALLQWGTGIIIKKTWKCSNV